MQLVEFETNKYIHGSYHHKKYQDRYNLEHFIRFIELSSDFKDHKDFNELTTFFQPSIELLCIEILDELKENGLKRKKPRLELFFSDLEYVLNRYDSVVKTMDFSHLKSFFNSAKKNIFSLGNLDLTIADMSNFLNEYHILEKQLIIEIIQSLSYLIEFNYQFVLGQFWYDDDLEKYRENATDRKIQEYFSILLVVLLSKNITKNEIVKLFDKLASESKYRQYVSSEKLYFDAAFPIDLENTFSTIAEYNYILMETINNLSIKERFDRFIELLYEEKQCYYIFQILNTSLHKGSELTHGDVIYYNQDIFKSRGYKNYSDEVGRDTFRSDFEVKAILPFRTKRYFSGVSLLKAKSVVENNIVFLKLLGNSGLDEKVEFFTPSPSKMDVSYSHYVLDEEYFFLSSSMTIYDGNQSHSNNKIFPVFYKIDEMNKKLDSFIKYLSYKQKETILSKNDLLILQSLQKFKQAVESVSYSQILLHTWNGFEFIAKAFTKNCKALDEKEKIDKVLEIVELIYSFVYTNKWHEWDLSIKQAQNEVKRRAERIVIYAYAYRNKIVHSHLTENAYMISISRGLNIVFGQLLSALMEKIILDHDYTIEGVFFQLQSDLAKRVEEIKRKKDTH